MPTTVPLIELQHADVVSSHSSAVVVHDVDWTISASQFWVVGGGYGTGKTDLLSTAAALQRPENGRVLLYGADVAHAPEPELAKLRKRVGLVLKHGGRMFANFTVLENVTLAVRYHDNMGAVEAAKKIEPILDATGLTQVATRIASTLSPNFRERIGIARALALHPEVLLLDEPLSGLDVTDQRWVIEFLQKLSNDQQEEPTTVVVGTNNFEPWTEHGTHFGILRNKRWLALGGREDLKDAMLETVPEV